MIDKFTSLGAAAKRGTFVELERSIEGADRIQGFVGGVGKKLTLLNKCSPDVFLDGYSAVCLQDIATVTDKSRGIHRRGLEAFGEKAATPEGVRLDSWISCIESIRSGRRLISIYNERVNPDGCYIGLVAGLSESTVRLHEVSSEAEWLDVIDWNVGDITRVDFDGRYERALYLVARPLPRIGERGRRLS